MKYSLLIIIITLSLGLKAQLQFKPINDRKMSVALSYAYPNSFGTFGDFNFSSHLTIGFITEKYRNLEVQFSYRINKYHHDSFLDLTFNANTQMYAMYFGGKKYFRAKPKRRLRIYLHWLIGVGYYSIEKGAYNPKNVFSLKPFFILPLGSGGFYMEMDKRFNIGVDIEGIIPTAYLKIGYRLY